LVDALVHQTAGRYVRAKGSARQAIELANALAAAAGEWTPYARTRLSLAHLLAAEATHSLQDRERRSQHLEQALKAADGAEWNTMHEAVSLRAVRWAVDDRRLGDAQLLLTRLPTGASRRTVALRIKLKLAQLTNDHQTAFETARLLAKHKAFSAPVAASLLRRLREALFTDCHDEDQLRATWTQLDRDEQRDPVLITSALGRLNALGLTASDASASARSLALVWCRVLLETYAEQKEEQRSASVRAMMPVLPILDGDWLPSVERAQLAHAADPWLLLLAAETYHLHRLWGKAEKAFQHATKQLPDPDLKAYSWTRLALLAEQKGQTEEALLAWKQAATQR
jgi:HemY protein